MRAAFQWAFLVLMLTALVAAGARACDIEAASEDARLRAFQQANREGR
jgi:hypothetical protein